MRFFCLCKIALFSLRRGADCLSAGIEIIAAFGDATFGGVVMVIGFGLWDAAPGVLYPARRAFSRTQTSASREREFER